MIASLELAIGDTCSGSRVNPVMTATAITQLLQRRNEDSTLGVIAIVADELSALFTSTLKAQVLFPHGGIFKGAIICEYYAVASFAVGMIRRSHRIHLCYFQNFTRATHYISSYRIVKAAFFESGAIIGSSFSRRTLQLSLTSIQDFPSQDLAS
jgi:hypothetical protein